jgi:hypothetical protein
MQVPLARWDQPAEIGEGGEALAHKASFFPLTLSIFPFPFTVT